MELLTFPNGKKTDQFSVKIEMNMVPLPYYENTKPKTKKIKGEFNDIWILIARPPSQMRSETHLRGFSNQGQVLIKISARFLRWLFWWIFSSGFWGGLYRL